MSDKDELERTGFEKWMIEWWPQSKGNFYFNHGHYTNKFMDYAWQGWLARSKRDVQIEMPPTVVTAEIGPAVSLEKMLSRLAVNGIKVKT